MATDETAEPILTHNNLKCVYPRSRATPYLQVVKGSRDLLFEVRGVPVKGNKN